jgi:hypothetical protein
MSKMRSVAAAVGAALMLAGQAELAAQEHILGLKGGINSFNVRQNSNLQPLDDTESQTNWAGGLYAAFGLHRVIGFQLEAIYSRRSIRAVDADEPIEAELRSDYFAFPLLVTARIPLNRTRLRPLVYAGPAVSFESKCEIEGTAGGIAASFDCDDSEVQLERKTTDWSLLFGGGVEYPVGRAVLGAEVRYSLGLTNLNGDAASRDVEWLKSDMWEFMVTLGIPIRP